MVQVPRINLNGTDQQSLIDGYSDAVMAVDRAILAVLRVTVHGRDYHMQSDSALDTALAEHRVRLLKLNEVRDELKMIVFALLNQSYERGARDRPRIE